MSRMYIYPEQEPGRDTTSPFYREQQERQRGNTQRMRGNRMEYRSDYGGYESRRGSRMEYGARPIGFEYRGRGGTSMHGGGHRGGEYEMGRGGSMMSQPISEQDAEEWVYSMKSADGSKAPKFQYKDVEKMLNERGWDCDPLDVWVGMNALYSDLCEVNAKFGITAEHKDYWLEAACAYWLDDEDAVEDKLTAYYNHVVK